MNIILSPSECGVICNALNNYPDIEVSSKIKGMLCDEVYLYFLNSFCHDEKQANEYMKMWTDEFGLDRY